MAQPTGQKILRIGIVQNGKIIEERLLRKRGTRRVPLTTKDWSAGHFHTAKALPRYFIIGLRATSLDPVLLEPQETSPEHQLARRSGKPSWQASKTSA